jgi:hypothetical protein
LIILLYLFIIYIYILKMGIFQDVMNAPEDIKQDLLGPEYNYWNFIKPPSDVDYPILGSIGTEAWNLSANVAALEDYIRILTSGGGTPDDPNMTQRTLGGLGAKYFLPTGGQCTDKASGKTVARSIYIDNAPGSDKAADIFGDGANDSKGLVAGVVTNVVKLLEIPIELMSSMGMAMEGNADCQSVYLATVDGSGGVPHEGYNTESRYLIQADINNLSTCEFYPPGNPEPQHTMAQNPKLGCAESFANYSDSDSIQFPKSNNQEIVSSKMPNDILIKIFYSALGLSGLFILWKILYKNKYKCKS